VTGFLRAGTICILLHPISEGIDNLAAILRWVAADPERSFAKRRVSHLDQGIGSWFAGCKTIADFITRPALL
jgi:hypothetical protein